MIQVGRASVCLERREAFLNGKPLNLGGRAFDIITVLIRAHGRIVSKDELISQVWRDTIVEDNNLQVHISALRKALGDKSTIQTVPRRGYRLVTTDREETASGSAAPPAPSSETLSSADQEQTPGVVYIVDDDLSVRNSLSRLLKSHGFYHQCFGSAEEFLSAQLADETACLLLDVSLPLANGLELQTELTRRNRPWPIVFMTGNGSIPMSVQAMKAGAVEFLTKPFDDQMLLSTLTGALGKAHARQKLWRETELARGQHARLTAREREVFSLLITGMANKQIARHLGTSEVTVKVHKKRVMEKLQADSVVTLVAKARLLAPLSSDNLS